MDKFSTCIVVARQNGIVSHSVDYLELHLYDVVAYVVFVAM